MRNRYFRFAFRLKGRRILERAIFSAVAGGLLLRSAAIIAFGGPQVTIAFQTGLVVGAGLVWARRP